MPEPLDFCGCCEGVATETPASVENRPGLSALAYRVGTHGRFKESMRAALAAQAALDKLTTRVDDDPSVALLDAWATVLDVLSFYQERIADEGYLRTATERRSVLEMARRIGYELGPGVAAGTYLAFTLQTGPGAPEAATVHVGTQAQSLPGQDETPQTFETVEAIEVRAEWQAMRARPLDPIAPLRGMTGLWLEGVGNNLSTGDGVLLVGSEREADPCSERWDFRLLKTVELDRDRGLTWVEFESGLGDDATEPAADATVYVFRQRAALFGHNAPDWNAMPAEVRSRYKSDSKQIDDSDEKDWPGFSLSDIAGGAADTVYLDALYPKIVPESWVVLAKPGYVELYRVRTVAEGARTRFTLSAKTTRLVLEGEHLEREFNEAVRETVVFAVSEALVRAPFMAPVFGTEVELVEGIEGLAEGRLVAVSGAPVRQVRVAEAMADLTLIVADGAMLVKLQAGDVLEVVAPPERQADGQERWYVAASAGIEGYVLATPGALLPETVDEEEHVREVAVLERLADGEDGGSRLTFVESLAHVYHRETVVLNANVAPATHGKTVTGEVLGSGDGSASFQQFTLKQTPLTHVSAATASGTANTLEVRVDGVRWDEVPSLYAQPPDARVYVTRRADDGTVAVQFGDGRSGARLPTGVENVTASYRYGIGLEGLVEDEQISLLMTRPLGVKGVVNPTAPTGAADPEALADARGNAPLTVLTLDRIVSVQDFEDFAAAFAGVGKAQATVLWSGERRIVHLTVAGVEGAEVTDALYDNLLAAIDAARPVDEDVVVASYDDILFTIEARVVVDEAYVAEDVATAVEAALLDAFSFEARAFGQGVTTSEVLAVMQAVAGVVAVDLDLLDEADPFTTPRLLARTARWDDDDLRPAQLLTIAPDGITLATVAP